MPLVLEYKAVATRFIGEIPLTETDIDAVIDYLCAVANYKQIFYLWRPFLADPGDDMVLELAVVANCEFIVTYNLKDFRGGERFGIQIITPKAFLEQIGTNP